MKIMPEIPSLSRIKRIFQESLAILIGKTIAVIGSFVGLRILSHVLSPEIYGELALGLTGAVLVNQMLMGPISSATLRFYSSAKEAEQLSSYFKAIRYLLLQSTLVVFFVTLLLGFVLTISGYFKFFGLCTFSGIFALFSGYISVMDAIQNAARRRVIVAWHQNLFSWGKFMIAIGLISLLHANSTVTIAGYCLAAVVVIISQIIFLKHNYGLIFTGIGNKIKNNTWVNQIRDYAWPFATWGVFTWAQLVSDRWALQFFTTTQDVGLFVVLFQIGYNPIIMLSGLFLQFIQPIIFQRAGDGLNKQRRIDTNKILSKLVYLLLIFTILLFFCAILLHKQVFSLLTDVRYHTVSWMLPGPVLGAGLLVAGQVASLFRLSANQPKALILPRISMALLGIIFNMIGAFLFGIKGVILANIFMNGGYLLWVGFLKKEAHNI